jgi:hypothetical protein
VKSKHPWTDPKLARLGTMASITHQAGSPDDMIPMNEDGSPVGGCDHLAGAPGFTDDPPCVPPF